MSEDCPFREAFDYSLGFPDFLPTIVSGRVWRIHHRPSSSLRIVMTRPDEIVEVRIILIRARRVVVDGTDAHRVEGVWEDAVGHEWTQITTGRIV